MVSWELKEDKDYSMLSIFPGEYTGIVNSVAGLPPPNIDLSQVKSLIVGSVSDAYGGWDALFQLLRERLPSLSMVSLRQNDEQEKCTPDDKLAGIVRNLPDHTELLILTIHHDYPLTIRQIKASLPALRGLDLMVESAAKEDCGFSVAFCEEVANLVMHLPQLFYVNFGDLIMRDPEKCWGPLLAALGSKSTLRHVEVVRKSFFTEEQLNSLEFGPRTSRVVDRCHFKLVRENDNADRLPLEAARDILLFDRRVCAHIDTLSHLLLRHTGWFLELLLLPSSSAEKSQRGVASSGKIRRGVVEGASQPKQKKVKHF